MSSALGILKWQPEVFWGSTLYEYTAGMKGHLLSQGISTTEPMTRNEYLAMKREDDKRKRGH
jgi:hypothetical protein